MDSSLNSTIEISFNSTIESIDMQRNNVFQQIHDNPSTDKRKKLIEKSMEFYLRHNLTLVCFEDHMKMLNECLGNEMSDCEKFPTGKKKIIEVFKEGRDLFDIISFVICDKCKNYSKIDSQSEQKMKCTYCDIALKKNETIFFVSIPIEKQIVQSLTDNWSHISKFDTSSENETQSYSDAHDGAILKNLLKQYKDQDVNLLSLCLNLDGANKFKSNSFSVWPMQLIQNYLPPHIRFLPHNIIVAGLYYHNVKLNCFDYLEPLVAELNHLRGNHIVKNIESQDYTFKPVITHCSVDLPAKSMLQETKQYGAYFGCTYCEIHGEQVVIEKCKIERPTKASRNKKTLILRKKSLKESKNKKPTKFVRYVEGTEQPKLRSEIETLQKMLVASALHEKESIDGIKDVSCLVALEHFNIIKSMGVDYMHCVLLGVKKRLLNLFLNPKYHGKDFYIAPKRRHTLNMKILAMKPTKNIVRKPRSLEQRSNFKASEYRTMLLYYLPVCLPGCVPKKYVDHVRRLSGAVYILLKKKISSKEVDDAEEMLNRFVKDHQDFFGKEEMVMVIHLLKHLAESVRQLGPLWCHSTFPFERNNGCLLRLVNGTSDVLDQIASKYCLAKSLVRTNEKSKIDTKILLGKGVNITETSSNVLNIDSLETVNFLNIALCVHKRIKLDKTIYTSLMYTRPKKSVDYFIGLKNGTIGMAKYYFDFNGKLFVMLQEFDIVGEINHILKVHTANKNIMAPIDFIETKYLFMKVGINQYIASEPNPYENE